MPNSTLSPPERYYIKIGSDEIHFNVLLNCPQTTAFEEKGALELKRSGIEPRSSWSVPSYVITLCRQALMAKSDSLSGVAVCNTTE